MLNAKLLRLYIDKNYRFSKNRQLDFARNHRYVHPAISESTSFAEAALPPQRGHYFQTLRIEVFDLDITRNCFRTVRFLSVAQTLSLSLSLSVLSLLSSLSISWCLLNKGYLMLNRRCLVSCLVKAA